MKNKDAEKLAKLNAEKALLEEQLKGLWTIII